MVDDIPAEEEVLVAEIKEIPTFSLITILIQKDLSIDTHLSEDFNLVQATEIFKTGLKSISLDTDFGNVTNISEVVEFEETTVTWIERPEASVSGNRVVISAKI